ncbi:uncharacterized protein B0H64DRAFT_337564 [Chaetomium fimeti]|uniref:Ferric oxidoreductase domain-containing protein n=1 Tax=Chaetomium fimeti TaxID=1854472 RepID=A0AAE0LW24_9PEZI|nr:hypothetical protein B0H64DRAFT_337564 [Chaetomium fimeti]
MKGSRGLGLVLAAQISCTAAKDFYGRIAHGTIGLGQAQYAPVTCAYACRSSMGSWMLDCGHGDHGDDSHHGDHGGGDSDMSSGHMMSMMPTPECYATNDPFLMSLAWCIKTHCPGDLTISQLEEFWEMNVAGRNEEQPLPKYSYQDALDRITATPTTVYNSSLVLNGTELVSEYFYAMVYGSLEGIEINIALDNQYALVALLTCGISPVLLSLLRFLPLPQSWVSKFYAHVIDPPVFGTRHAVPALFGLGLVPTRGQALFIFYIWAINIILSAVAYRITWPNLWFTSISNEMVEWVANRTGMLSFANLVLALLYSSRNNLLLHVTSWSRNTFILIHRWTAVICILQACLHSALYLQMYDTMGPGMLTTESAYPYWYWGIIATFSLVLILPGSVLPVRQRAYEFFLDWHLLWALLSIIGCFLHIYFRYHWQWGYEIWVAVAFAVWAFDWLLARPLRVARAGFTNRAYTSIIDDDYLKVDIPGVEAMGQAYLYFPTLSWRIWENHPFSAIPMSHPTQHPTPGTPGSQPSDDLETGSVSKPTPRSTTSQTPSTHPHTPAAAGTSFFIRRRNGLTSRLAQHTEPTGVPVLVEASYGSEAMSVVRSPDPRPSLASPNVIFIAGGVGITALLPLLGRSLLAPRGRSRLYWGVRSGALVRAVEKVVGCGVGERVWGEVEVAVAVGERFDVTRVLEDELVGEKGVEGGTTVVVCGPPAMSDEVRLAVAGLARRGVLVRFMEERFSE